MFGQREGWLVGTVPGKLIGQSQTWPLGVFCSALFLFIILVPHFNIWIYLKHLKIKISQNSDPWLFLQNKNKTSSSGNSMPTHFPILPKFPAPHLPPLIICLPSYCKIPEWQLWSGKIVKLEALSLCLLPFCVSDRAQQKSTTS